MWSKFSLALLLIVCSISMFASPSICNSLRPNENHLSHKKHEVAKGNPTQQEIVIDKISELGHLTVCPFTVKENRLNNRIPSSFYELECQHHCSECGEFGSKCRQLVTEMKAVFFNETDNSSWTETLRVKAGCNCIPASAPTPANSRP